MISSTSPNVLLRIYHQLSRALAHLIAFTFIIIFTAEKEKRQNRMQQKRRKKK